MRVEQAAIDRRRQILAASGGQFKTSLDRILAMPSLSFAMVSKKMLSKKKSRAPSPAQKLCRPLISPKI
jgi:hypothetical protein